MLCGEAAVPIVSDVQCRFPSPSTIAFGDVLASSGFFDAHRPEIVVRVGPVPTSRRLWSWLQDSTVEQISIDDAGWRDPLGIADVVYRADPAVTFADLAGRIDAAPNEWLGTWSEADRAVGDAVVDTLANEAFPNEPSTARMTAAAAPSGATIYVASSMPIRDLDAFSGPPRGDVAVLANRGANGIDGLLSAAAGAASSDGRRVIALAGDLSVLHDATALGLIARHSLPVTIVATNNDGGGIFHFLPQASQLTDERFEALFGTPHGHSLAAIASAFGIEARTIATADELAASVAEDDGPLFVEIRTQRDENVRVHGRIYEAAAAAVASSK